MPRREVALILKQEFMSFEDAMDKWAIDGGFTFLYQKSDPTQRIVKCRLQVQCPYHVRAVWSEERGCVRVAKVDPEHTCLGAALPVRSVAKYTNQLIR